VGHWYPRYPKNGVYAGCGLAPAGRGWEPSAGRSVVAKADSVARSDSVVTRRNVARRVVRPVNVLEPDNVG